MFSSSENGGGGSSGGVSRVADAPFESRRSARKRTRTFVARTVIPRTAARVASRTAATASPRQRSAALLGGVRAFGRSNEGPVFVGLVSAFSFSRVKKSGFGPTTRSSDSSSTAMGSAPRACHGMTARKRATLPSRHVTGTTSPSSRRRYDPRSAASRISNVPERSATSSWSASRSSRASPSARRSANANTRRSAHAYARPSIVIATREDAAAARRSAPAASPRAQPRHALRD